MAKKTEKDLTEKQTEELVQKVLLMEGYERNEYVLGVLSEFVGMVFDEERTKVGQKAQLCEALADHEKLVRERAAGVPEDQRSMVDAGELVAVQFVQGAVDKAFGFSTYSGPQRRSYIQKAIKEQLATVKAELDPVRHILEAFKIT